MHSLSQPIRMPMTNPLIWYILTSNAATVCNPGAGDISNSKQMNNEEEACENLRFVPTNNVF